jgi:hypothetical protein
MLVVAGDAGADGEVSAAIREGFARMVYDRFQQVVTSVR